MGPVIGAVEDIVSPCVEPLAVKARNEGLYLLSLADEMVNNPTHAWPQIVMSYCALSLLVDQSLYMRESIQRKIRFMFRKGCLLDHCENRCNQ